MTANTATPRLPVADLDESCQRYLQQVKALLSPDDFAHTQRLVQDFLTHEGPTLHQALQRLDREAAQVGKSWLIDTWLHGYLAGRKPLPLASNVGFRLQTAGHALADWMAAFAAVCADHAHHRIEAAQSPQGTHLCMQQWVVLKGASRVARLEVDDYFIHPTGGQHIGFFHRGHYYRMRALDTDHEARPVSCFQAALEQILRQPPEPHPQPVGVPSFLPRDEAAQACAQLSIHPDNLELLRHLAQDLFHVALIDEDVDEDTELGHATFVPAQEFWCQKPITLRYNLTNGRLHIHSEHTAQDGGMLQALITLARQKLPSAPVHRTLVAQTSSSPSPASPVQSTSSSANPDPVASDPELQRHDWVLDEALKAQWAIWFERYGERAARMQVRSLCLPFGHHTVPRGISQDALMQFLLQYAQRLTWGTVRNTYEAVDVSHFQQGRTECVRPVSIQSLAFIEHWRQAGLDAGDTEASTLFQAALAEHKARIKACKLGRGPNRQLLGLQQMAEPCNLPMPALFTDDSYRHFSTDFLSTSTIGDDSVTINFGFAPTSTDGLGINYTLTDKGWLYTICHRTEQASEVERFVQALQTGAAELLAFAHQQTPPA